MSFSVIFQERIRGKISMFFAMDPFAFASALIAECKNLINRSTRHKIKHDRTGASTVITAVTISLRLVFLKII